MIQGLTQRLDSLLADLPRAYPGPGGAIAILREGEVLACHAWGYANAEQRIPFTPRTLFRMCSITKQFTCGVVLEAFGEPEALDAAVRARLPLLGDAAPPARLLCHNQSGLRDYWAVAMLHGSPVEAPFGDHESARVIAGTHTLHFAPGTRASYVNQNFRLLSDAAEEVSGRSFAELLRTLIFDRVGMDTAFLAADTRAMPDGTEGYEGTVASGFRAAENRIVWTGDAGIGASLDDMIAWEKHIDATRDDAASLHARLAAPVTFACGTPARYGFGLARRNELGHAVIGHGGALRGWRSHRFYAPTERISVVAMLNHLSDATAAATDAFAAVLGIAKPKPDTTLAPPPWLGTYVEPETGLSARIDAPWPGQLRLRYGQAAERLDLAADGSAAGGGTRLRPGNGTLLMERAADNQVTHLARCIGEATPDIAGRYRCAELAAELMIADAGGALYGAFQGFLGAGRMELLEPIGPDLWTLPCPRALDHTPPGDWTLAIQREGGRITGITVGCWLARGLPYARIG
ncbi:D-aminopeptidase [Elioraea sp.]|uniref:D-aminopeptidase n=1 Tax=Elioraea sp. TaxID=2185103 RepID=UPI0025BFF849|nr:D-aminopeptidase [Elioraea sp.]